MTLPVRALLAQLACATALAGPPVLAHTVLGSDADPWRTWLGNDAPQFLSGQWWRPLTGALVHLDDTHLVSNVMLLLALAACCTALWGGWRTVLTWLVATLAAGALSDLARPEQFTVGGSAGVFALGGALAAVMFLRRRSLGWRPALVMFYVGLLALGASLGPGVDSVGHLTGWLTGIVAGLLLGHRARRRAAASTPEAPETPAIPAAA